MANPRVFRIPVPSSVLAFTGERFTTAQDGELRHEHLHRYFFALQFCAGKQVLDVASGEGYGAALIGIVASQVVGVDIAPDAVRHANSMYCDRNISFKLGDAGKLPIEDESIDVVLSFETIEHLGEQENFLREIKRVLRPGGILVMSSPDHDTYSGGQGICNPHHVRELTRDEFHSLIRRHFKHAAFLAQQSVMGSIVAPDGNESSLMGYQGFKHLYDNCFEMSESLPSAVYLVSVASDGLLPRILTGSFDDRPFQLGLYAELQRRHEEMLRREAESAALARCVASLNGDLSHRDAEIVRLNQTLADNAAESRRTHEEMLRRDSEMAGLTHGVASLSQDLSQRDAEIARLNQTLADNAAELRRGHQEMLHSDSEIARLTQCVASLNEDLANRNAEIVRLNQTLADNAAAAVSKLEEEEVRRNALQSALVASATTIDHLNKTVEKTQAKVDEQDNRLIELAVENGFEREKTAQLSALVSELETEIEELTTRLVAVHQEHQLQRIQTPLAHRQATQDSGRLTTPSKPGPRQDVEVAAHDASFFLAFGRIVRREYALVQLKWCGLAKTLETVRSSGIIDPDFYLAQYPDVRNAGLDAAAHYVLAGAAEGRNPNPLFHTLFYVNTYPEVALSGSNPLAHYLDCGARQGFRPNPLFETSFYLESSPDAAAAGVNPLAHYIHSGAAQGRDPHPLFHTSYYLEHNPDVAATGVNPLAHYIHSGAAQGRDPHPLFHTSYYFAHNPDVAAAGSNPLAHYIHKGVAEGRDPHPLFDTSYYLEHNPDVVAAGVNPLLHYFWNGGAEGRDPHPIFDTSYYLERNPDVMAAGINPLAHYIRFGAEEARDPHPLFDTSYYLERNPDVAAAGLNPLIHYITEGAAQCRDPHPLFDSSYYAELNPSVMLSGLNPLVHYLLHGGAESKDPHPLFQSAYYLSENIDVSNLGMNALVHYVTTGAAEGRDPHPLFHSLYYLKRYPDAAAAGVNPLVHYLLTGAAEGGDPHPLFKSAYYLLENSDVSSIGINPLAHYVTRGTAQSRDPHPLFDTSYYATRNPDVLAAGVNPLHHYYWNGGAEGRDPHPLFDSSYYLEQYFPEGNAPNPLEHYYEIGSRKGHNPNALFNVSYYRETHADVAASTLDPLVHYIKFGRRSGYIPYRNLNFANVLEAPAALDDTTISMDEIVRQKRLRTEVEVADYRPLISVLVPVFNTPGKYLRLAVDSVVNQIYSNWELCVWDDGSTSADTRGTVEYCAAREPRIQAARSETNQGISAATNGALSLARGEFVALLDHDDELLPESFAEVVKRLNEDRDLDVIYSDQQYVNADGSFDRSFHKPDWSREMFRGVMYVGHLLVVRRELMVEIGGCDSKYDFVQDFEMMLRLSERTSRIGHLPRNLYKWRRIPGSVAFCGNAKHGIEPLQAAAVNAHFERCGMPALAISNPAHAHRLLIRPKAKQRYPAVTILIHGIGRDITSTLRQVQWITSETAYPNYDIAVLDTGLGLSVDQRSRLVAAGVSVVAGGLECAAEVDGEYVVAVQAGLRVGTPDWIKDLLLYGERPEIAAVCPLILASEGLVHSAGMIIGMAGGIVPAMKGWSPDSDGYAGSLSCAREVSVVPPDCFLIEKNKLRQLGVERLFVTRRFQAADLSMRALDAGMRNIFTPRALVRQSSEYREERDGCDVDRRIFAGVWRERLAAGDRFHSPNFSREGFGFTDVVPAQNSSRSIRSQL